MSKRVCVRASERLYFVMCTGARARVQVRMCVCACVRARVRERQFQILVTDL